MTGATIRVATETDAPALLAIYAPVVRTSAITFAYEPPSVAEFAERVRTVAARWPWLVYDTADGVRGYAYGTTWRVRASSCTYTVVSTLH